MSEKSSEQYLEEISFFGREQVLKGLSYSESFKFLIPDEAPPSLRSEVYETCVDISWRVEAALDIVGARDIRQTRTLTVLPMVPDHAPPATEDKGFNQCGASLALSSTRVPPGKTVDGKFRVQLRQDLRVHCIRVELECWEKAGDKEKRTVNDVVSLKGQNWLSGELLTANQTMEWPIRLKIPENALPSTVVYHTQVAWGVKAVLHRLIRSNLEVQQPIQVFIDPAGL